MAQEPDAGIDLDMGADASRTVGNALAEHRPPRACTSSRVKARLAAAVWRTASATVPSEIWQRSRMHIAGAGRGGFHRTALGIMEPDNDDPTPLSHPQATKMINGQHRAHS
jgi:hypothetical protein